MISPVRPRSKASGLTRIRVRLMDGAGSFRFGRSLRGRGAPRALDRRAARSWQLAVAALAPLAWPSARAGGARLSRLPALGARLLAAWPARCAAVPRARRRRPRPRSTGRPSSAGRAACRSSRTAPCSLRRQLGQRRKLGSTSCAAVAGSAGCRAARGAPRRPAISSSRSSHVLEVLRRAHDRVDDRPDEREQRGRRRAADQHRVVDAPARVRVGPVDQREPDHDQEEDQQVDGQVEAVVLDAEEGEGHAMGCSR